ncbi:uncharacterized protein LOC117180526 [Belonocnema kinseyi]|uniref:uncharacterized protein LOC117180526 n=1 Tax=Belonocnema kinseyi TaxID=2817044 RepID=UPI00143DE901|nr:uncharacterized protein LOC117180526 [Belonocnema kinseyi]
MSHGFRIHDNKDSLEVTDLLYMDDLKMYANLGQKLQQKQVCPLGTGQRRPSRSPRSPRSRFTDVDCLKKYTERLVEERRLTEISDPNQLDSSKWIPLSKNVNQLRFSSPNHSGFPIRNDGRDLDLERVRIDSTRWMPVSNRKVCPENMQRSSHAQVEDTKYVKSPVGRSLSNESNFSRIDNYHRERRNTEFGYYGRESFDRPRWLQSEILTSRYIPSPLDTKYSEASTSKPMSNKWMTFTRYPSPCPIVRRNTEGRPSTSERRSEINWSDKSKENMKSFTTNDNRAVQAPNIDCTRLRQRIRDLYDIKTETEFPKRLNYPLRENAWISKSSSEEEKYPTRSGRRNSQELEFNDRFSKFNHLEEKPEVKSKKSTDSSFADDWEERLRKFHERLRFSEDLGIDQKIRARDRITSDDYEDMSRRQSREETFGRGIKRNSDASSRSRVSYAEVDFSDLSKRGSRTSDASYVSISTLSPKRGSIENRNVSISTYRGKSKSFESQNVPRAEIIPQRVVSQSLKRRPSAPVPPKEMDAPLRLEKPFNQLGRKKIQNIIFKSLK